MIGERKQRMSYLVGRKAQEVLEVVNPLSLIDPNGRLRVFKNTSECYSAALIRMYTLYPKGYVDIPHFLIKTQGIRMGAATTTCGRKQYASIHWKSLDKASETRIKTILYHMLKLTGCAFSENAYMQAMWEFKKNMACLQDEDITISIINNTKV